MADSSEGESDTLYRISTRSCHLNSGSSLQRQAALGGYVCRRFDSTPPSSAPLHEQTPPSPPIASPPLLRDLLSGVFVTGTRQPMSVKHVVTFDEIPSTSRQAAAPRGSGAESGEQGPPMTSWTQYSRDASKPVLYAQEFFSDSSDCTSFTEEVLRSLNSLMSSTKHTSPHKLRDVEHSAAPVAGAARKCTFSMLNAKFRERSAIVCTNPMALGHHGRLTVDSKVVTFADLADRTDHTLAHSSSPVSTLSASLTDHLKLVTADGRREFSTDKQEDFSAALKRSLTSLFLQRKQAERFCLIGVNRKAYTSFKDVLSKSSEARPSVPADSSIPRIFSDHSFSREFINEIDSRTHVLVRQCDKSHRSSTGRAASSEEEHNDVKLYRDPSSCYNPELLRDESRLWNSPVLYESRQRESCEVTPVSSCSVGWSSNVTLKRIYPPASTSHSCECAGSDGCSLQLTASDLSVSSVQFVSNGSISAVPTALSDDAADALKRQSDTPIVELSDLVSENEQSGRSVRLPSVSEFDKWATCIENEDRSEPEAGCSLRADYSFDSSRFYSAHSVSPNSCFNRLTYHSNFSHSSTSLAQVSCDAGAAELESPVSTERSAAIDSAADRSQCNNCDGVGSSCSTGGNVSPVGRCRPQCCADRVDWQSVSRRAGASDGVASAHGATDHSSDASRCDQWRVSSPASVFTIDHQQSSAPEPRGYHHYASDADINTIDVRGGRDNVILSAIERCSPTAAMAGHTVAVSSVPSSTGVDASCSNSRHSSSVPAHSLLAPPPHYIGKWGGSASSGVSRNSTALVHSCLLSVAASDREDSVSLGAAAGVCIPNIRDVAQLDRAPTRLSCMVQPGDKTTVDGECVSSHSVTAASEWQQMCALPASAPFAGNCPTLSRECQQQSSARSDDVCALDSSEEQLNNISEPQLWPEERQSSGLTLRSLSLDNVTSVAGDCDKQLCRFAAQCFDDQRDLVTTADVSALTDRLRAENDCSAMPTGAGASPSHCLRSLSLFSVTGRHPRARGARLTAASPGSRIPQLLPAFSSAPASSAKRSLSSALALPSSAAAAATAFYSTSAGSCSAVAVSPTARPPHLLLLQSRLPCPVYDRSCAQSPPLACSTMSLPTGVGRDRAGFSGESVVGAPTLSPTAPTLSSDEDGLSSGAATVLSDNTRSKAKLLAKRNEFRLEMERKNYQKQQLRLHGRHGVSVSNGRLNAAAATAATADGGGGGATRGDKRERAHRSISHDRQVLSEKSHTFDKSVGRGSEKRISLSPSFPRAGNRSLPRSRVPTGAGKSVPPATRSSQVAKPRSPSEGPGAGIRGQRNGAGASSVSLFEHTMGAFAQPRVALEETYAKLAASDWEVVVAGLTDMVRLARYHPATVAGDVKAVVSAVVLQCRNLRSQVMRAAVQTAQHLFQHTGRAIEPEMGLLVEVLLHRTGDTNRFIRADSLHALETMVAHVSAARAVLVITQYGVSHRNSQVRCSAALLLCHLVQRLGVERSLASLPTAATAGSSPAAPTAIAGQLVTAAVQLVRQGDLQTRKHAKKMFEMWLEHPDLERILARYLSSSQQRDMTKLLDSIQSESQKAGTSSQPSGLNRTG